MDFSSRNVLRLFYFPDHFLLKKTVLPSNIRHLSNGIKIEGGQTRHPILHLLFQRGKEVNILRISSSDCDCEREITIQHQFDCVCRKALRGEASDYRREMARRAKYEVTFSELSESEMNRLYVLDEYEMEKRTYHVLDFDVEVKSELIAEALDALPKQKRDVILLSYFLEMSDAEIARKMNLVRSTIHHHRTSSLKLLKNLLKEDKNNE